MSLKNLQDMMTKEKRKREMVKATQNFVAGMSAAFAMTAATGVLVAIKMKKGYRNTVVESKVAPSIKDNVQKKAESIRNSAVHHKKMAEHMIKDLRAKADEMKEDIKS